MINILSYVGMNMQSEVCLWTLLGLVRTIFDATLFKVNANLKQVWQMTMPEELSMPVQRVLRTMISGVMLVQCFTVYVYLASYIVLLYPVFLEERPTLVLPWLLLAAIRKLLCELTSLALGLGTCVLLGPARPPCIKFVVVKFTSIMPAFYMWMLVFSYYHALKVAAAFKTFPAVLPPNDHDYGLELAVRRRRTKSLLGEEQLRKKLVANFYGESSPSITDQTYLRTPIDHSSRITDSPDTSAEESSPSEETKPLTVSTTGWSDIGAYEDWFGSEVMIPRDTDRILEQIVLMLLRIGAYLKKEGLECLIDSDILNSAVPASWLQRESIDCSAMNADDTDTPPLVGSVRGNVASYLREYPQIFMKKVGTDVPPTELTLASLKTVHSHVGSEDGNTSRSRKRVTPDTSTETLSVKVENVASKKRMSISDIHSSEVVNDKPKQHKPKRTRKSSEGKTKQKKNEPEPQIKVKSDIPNGMQSGILQDFQVYKMSSNENKLAESIDAVSSHASDQQTSKKTRENPPETSKPPVVDYTQIPIIVQKDETNLKGSKESLIATTARSLVRQGSRSSSKKKDHLERKELEFRFQNDSDEIITKEKHSFNDESTNTTPNQPPNQQINEEKKESKDSASQSDYVIEIKRENKNDNDSKSHQISLNENNNEQTQTMNISDEHTSSPISDEHNSRPILDKHTARPISYEHTSRPISDEHTARPVSNEHISSPISDENISSAISDEHISSPISDEHISSLISDEHISRLISDEHISRPISEEHTARPISDEHNSRPISHEYTSRLISDENISRPISYEHTARPISDEHTSSPISDEHISRPNSDEHTVRPNSDEHTARPISDEHTSSPISEEHTARPISEEHTSSPISDEYNSRPISEEHTARPISYEHTARPISEEHTARPISDEHTSSPISDEYNSRPISNEHTARPISDGHTARPISYEHFSSPFSDEHTSRLISDEHISRLISYEHTSSPISDEHTSRPISDEHISRLISDEHISRPISDEHTSRPISDEHISRLISDEHISSPISDEHTSRPISDEHTARPISYEHTVRPISDEHTSSSISDEHISKPISDEQTSRPISDEHTSSPISDEHTAKDIDSQPHFDTENPNTSRVRDDDVNENDLDENKMPLKLNRYNESNISICSRDQNTPTQNSDESENSDTKPSPDNDLLNKPNTQ